MRKILVIRIIYDLMSLLIIGSIAYILFIKQNQISLAKDYELTINDTVELDGNGKEQLFSVSDRAYYCSYIDNKGNAITADDYDKYLNHFLTKYQFKERSSHLDSLKVNTEPRVVIKKVKAKINFLYKGEKPFIYSIGRVYLITMFFLAIITLLLIRRLFNLTLRKGIYSQKGVSVFKYLFILSIIYFFCKFSYQYLYMHNIQPIWLGAINKHHEIHEVYSITYDFNEIFIHLVLIITTFCIFQAFKYGHEVKTENDLTI